MDLKQLQALLAVADYGSFTAAADALGTVQSNVSSHISRLEAELQTTLVDRGSRRLTEVGELVAARARRIQAELDAITSDVASIGQEVVGTVRLGMISTTARWLVPLLLRLVRDRHPRLRLEATEGTARGLEPLLAMGHLHLTVGPAPPSGEDFDFVPLFDEQLVLVVRADHPLGQRASVSLRDLVELPLLLPLPGTSFRQDIDEAAKEAGIRLRVEAEVDGTRLLASLTYDGYGPAILPATAHPDHVRDSWSAIPVEDLKPRRVGILQRRRGLPSLPARAVMALLFELTGPNAQLPAGLSSCTKELFRQGERSGGPSRLLSSSL
jgi:DNA-binding transcriptional LysR family regulator